jgi:hypothetical protein
LYRRTRNPKSNKLVAAKRAKREGLDLKPSLSKSLDDRTTSASI